MHTRHGQRPGGDQWRNRESHSIDSDRVGEGGGALPWRRLPFFCRLCRCHGDRNTNIQLVVMATLHFLQSTRSSSHLSIKDATTIDWSRQSIDLSVAPTHRRWLAAGPSRDFKFCFSKNWRADGAALPNFFRRYANERRVKSSTWRLWSTKKKKNK